MADPDDPDDPDKPTRDELLAQARETSDRLAAEARARLAADREAHPPTVEQQLAEQAARAKAVRQRARKRNVSAQRQVSTR